MTICMGRKSTVKQGGAQNNLLLDVKNKMSWLLTQEKRRKKHTTLSTLVELVGPWVLKSQREPVMVMINIHPDKDSTETTVLARKHRKAEFSCHVHVMRSNRKHSVWKYHTLAWFLHGPRQEPPKPSLKIIGTHLWASVILARWGACTEPNGY